MSLPAHNAEFVPLMECLQDGPQALAVLWDVAQLISMKSPAGACPRPQELGWASTWSLSSDWCNPPKQAWLLQWDSHTHFPEILGLDSEKLKLFPITTALKWGLTSQSRSVGGLGEYPPQGNDRLNQQNAKIGMMPLLL